MDLKYTGSDLQNCGGGGGESECKALLKTHNLLIFRHAKNAEHCKIAPNWKLSGTWDFQPASEFLEEDRYSPATASSFQLTLARRLPTCQNAFLDNFRIFTINLTVTAELAQNSMPSSTASPKRASD
jgi:hypothetical protein